MLKIKISRETPDTWVRFLINFFFLSLQGFLKNLQVLLKTFEILLIYTKSWFRIFWSKKFLTACVFVQWNLTACFPNFSLLSFFCEESLECNTLATGMSKRCIRRQILCIAFEPQMYPYCHFQILHMIHVCWMYCLWLVYLILLFDYTLMLTLDPFNLMNSDFKFKCERLIIYNNNFYSQTYNP